MKRTVIAFVGVVAFCQCMAQNTIEEINGIKLSKNYFTSEATAPNFEDAKKIAFANLMENIDSYCEEMETGKINEAQVKDSLQTKSVKRGEVVMALVYVSKSIVGKMPQQTVLVKPPVIIPPVEDSSVSDTPDIIKRVCEIDSYARLQYLLDMAESNGIVKAWGKWRMMNNHEACYLVMINADRQIVSVLSPVRKGCRTDMKSGMLMDSEKMKSFNNRCVAICVLVK